MANAIRCPNVSTNICGKGKCAIYGTPQCIGAIPRSGKCPFGYTPKCSSTLCGIWGKPLCVGGIIRNGSDTDTDTGTIQIGYYRLSPGINHTYAKMTVNNQLIKFPCYGGTDDTPNTFPAEFWTPETCGGSKRMGKVLQCNQLIARRLATWTDSVDLTITNYNRKSGGWLNLGDCSGLVYALQGLCHQMCNTIACSTKINDPANSGVNWPPDLNGSIILYGFRGHFSFEINERIRYWRNFDATFILKGEEPSDSAILDLKQKTDSINTTQLAELNNELRSTFDSSALANLIETDWNAAETLKYLKEQPYYNDISEKYASALNKKKDLDNMLVREQIRNVDYANEINALLAQAAIEYANVATPSDFMKAFGVKVDEKVPPIIDVSLMPATYAGVREALKL